MTAVFPLARYRFEFEVTAAIRLPEYAGSALRGAFGHTLRQLACVTRARTCDGCMLALTCPYTCVFEPQKSAASSLSLATPPVPYIIEPPAWGEKHYAPGERITFHFTLIGKACDQLPLCIMAWRRAFARGVGAGEGTAELIEVSHQEQTGAAPTVGVNPVGANSVGANLFAHIIENRSNATFLAGISPSGESSQFEPTKIDKLIYRPGETVTDHPRSLALADSNVPDSVTLEFITPLRLQENGCALPPNRLTPRPLLTALARRASLLSEHYQGQPLFTPAEFAGLAQAASSIEGQVQMEWRDWTRRSARQQCTMQLGGCIGNWTLTGDLTPFWNLLRLGEHLHVGKEASFGLGQYQIKKM